MVYPHALTTEGRRSKVSRLAGHDIQYTKRHERAEVHTKKLCVDFGWLNLDGFGWLFSVVSLVGLF